MKEFEIDFVNGALRYRHDHVQGRNELILKAIGLKKNAPPLVLDATAGCGREAFLIASSGCEVILCERHPTVANLLREALLRATEALDLLPTLSRMTLHHTCAIHYLLNHPDFYPDVIYCDPMFEPRQKSALVKKELQYLQRIVGQDEDAAQLVKLALSKAKKRVVVKRALSAPLLWPKVDITYKARSHRFDVYLCPKAHCL